MAQRQTSLGFASDPTATLSTGLVNDRLSPAGTVPMADSNAWDSSAPPESTTISGVDPLDPYGVGNARKPLIDATKHPLKAIGVLLLNMAQGATGQPLYTDKLRKRQQEDMQIGVEKMKLMTNALPQAMDMIKKAPANTRMDLAKTYSATIGRSLGADFSDILMKAAQSPDNSGALISRFGKRGQQMLDLAGGDFDGAMKLLVDDKLQGRFDEEENKSVGAQLLDHLNAIDETLDGTPEYDQIQAVMKGGVTSAEMRDPLFQRASGITNAMVDVYDRSPELQESLRGIIIPPSDQKLAAEEEIKNQFDSVSGTKVMREIDGKKVASFINPKNGKEMFSIPTGISASENGQKTTSADIKTAVALRLQGKDPSKAGLPAGAVEATDGMNEDQLMALGGSLSSGMVIRQTKDGMEVITGGMASAQQRSKEKIAESERETTKHALSLFNLGDRIIEMVKVEPNSINFGGTLARTIDNFTADVVGTAETLGIDIQKNLDLPANDPNKLTTLDPKQAPDALFGALAGRSAEFKSAVFQLAIVDAAMQGTAGHSMSDKDLAASIQKVGGGVSSVGQLSAKVGEIQHQAYDKLRIEFQVNNWDPATGSAPAFPTIDEMRARARGDKPPTKKDSTSTAEPPTPKTQAEFDALPAGATYRDPDDNKLYRKP